MNGGWLAKEVKMKYAIFFSVFFVSSGFCSQYVAIKGTFSNLGGKATSTHYILKSAAGQSVTGQSWNVNYIEQAGFYTYFTVGEVGIEEQETQSVPEVFSLSQPYPNPAANGVAIKYEVPGLSCVKIRVYDVTGRVVKTLVAGERKSGFYNLRWDGTTDQGAQVAQGIYFIRMLAPDFRAVRKVVLLK
jgi:hypothetical protein